MEQGIIVPSFMDRNGFVTGFEVWPIFEQVFPNKQIIFVESSEIAANDGILNYISWAIKK
jgi:agmatine/peptidylarginine deiminase